MDLRTDGFIELHSDGGKRRKEVERAMRSA